MNRSESINELATALAAAQSEIWDPLKSSQSFSGNYADLASVLHVVRKVLPKHGLTVSQLLTSTQEAVEVETALLHSSGQFITSVFSMPVEESKGINRAQSYGVAVTYLRRYALASIVGISQSDTDGSPIILVSEEQAKTLVKAAEKLDESTLSAALSYLGITKFADLPSSKYSEAGKVVAKASAAKKTDAAKLKKGIE